MSSQPNMHRCLKVPELFLTICSFSGNHELLQLSLTCRSLCSDALDALWYSPSEGITALLRCFPDDVIEKTVIEKTQDEDEDGLVRRFRRELSIRRIPEAQDWDRVRVYANRIRELHISDECSRSGTPTDECYRLFLNHWPYPDQPIFPNLCGATLSPTTFRIGSLLFAAVAEVRPLRKLGVGIDGEWSSEDEFNFEQVEKAFHACRDSVISVWLSFEYIPPAEVVGLADRISSAICTFSSVRQVNLRQSFPLSSKALSHLALLPDLTRLSFMYTSVYDNPQILAPHPDNFRDLKTLDLRISETTGLDEVYVLFQNLRSTRLETVSVSFEEEPLVARLFDLICSFARFTSIRTLKLMGLALEVLLEDDCENWPIQCTSIISILSPLRYLHTLVFSYLSLHVTPDDIRNIAHLWPELRTLELSASDEFTTTTVRAADLHPLVTGCPRLHKIILPIVGDSNDAEEDDGHEPVDEQLEHRGVRIVTVCLHHGVCFPRRPTPEDKAPLHRMFPEARIEVAGVTRMGR